MRLNKIHLKNQLKEGFCCHTFLPTAKEVPMFCVWKDKEGVSDSEFQNFIAGPNAIGVHMGLDNPLNNHCQKIDNDLIGRESISKTILR